MCPECHATNDQELKITYVGSNADVHSQSKQTKFSIIFARKGGYVLFFYQLQMITSILFAKEWYFFSPIKYIYVP